MHNEQLRQIPKMDELLAQPALVAAEALYGHRAVRDAARAVLDRCRTAILSEEAYDLPGVPMLAEEAVRLAAQEAIPSLRRVINATGVVLHTNLGRAPLAEAAVQAVTDVARGYSTLEYDVHTGKRGSRHTHVEALLMELTGAEAAMVVNNNAAAVLLALGALCKGRAAIVSRGEQVEIGGSFRIPDIMALSGAILREVGTTNRTHPSDYEAAIGPETGVLFKAHTSNYRILGFTREVSLAELVEIGHAHGLPVLHDLGGGCLLLPEGGLAGEPCVMECVQSGADVICFSGDKLLGGPQAGILLGKKEHIARLKKHPLARAIRVDKMTLAALEATLRLYRDEALARREIPVQRMMRLEAGALRARAEQLASELSFLGGALSIADDTGALGGGTTPGYELPSVVLSISPAFMGAERLEAALRAWRVPIIARIAADRLLLDVRTLAEADYAEITQCLRAIATEEAGT